MSELTHFGTRVQVGTNWNSMSYSPAATSTPTATVTSSRHPPTPPETLHLYPGTGTQIHTN